MQSRLTYRSILCFDADKQQAALDTTFEGCYIEDSTRPDIPYRMWDRTDNTIQGCIQTCRNRGFQYAGLQV